MKKKTLRIFINSFAVSLFAIWTTNELMFAPQAEKKSADVEIPEKNIALFFQQDAAMVNFLPQEPISSSTLSAPAPQKNERDLMIDEGLFEIDEDKESGIKISSIEDVADIPLEASFNGEESINKAESSVLFSRNLDVAPEDVVIPEQNLIQISSLSSLPQTNLVPQEISINKEDKEILTDGGDFTPIPLEFGNSKGDTKIEIANHAPENQIAMADGGKVDLDRVAVDKKSDIATTDISEWHEMSEGESKDTSPWVVAKGTRNPKNNYVLEQKFYGSMSESEIQAALGTPAKAEEAGKEVKVAEMVKNILIPIPEDILNDKNLTPQLVSPKKNKKNKEEIVEESETEAEKSGGGILKSITSIFNSSDEGEDLSEDNSEVTDEEEETPKRRGLFSVFEKSKSASKILPAEIRLSFQPGRAEISGSTLRWVQAFANKVIEDPSVILEIRIDRTSSFELQQKRLNLLHNILTNKGVDYGKINTVFTSREPNSFIIRTLRISEDKENTAQENNKGQNLYYQSW